MLTKTEIAAAKRGVVRIYSGRGNGRDVIWGRRDKT
jgi:hypothetical protein